MHWESCWRAGRFEFSGSCDWWRDHPKQGAALTSAEPPLRSVGLGQGALGPDGDECSERAVMPFDPREVELGQLSGRHLALAEQLAEASNPCKREVVVCGGMRVCVVFGAGRHLVPLRW
jgi:hypothetical protein